MQPEKLKENESEFLKAFNEASSETLSKLSETEQEEYAAWAKTQNLNTLEEEKVYDLPGYWKDQVSLGEGEARLAEDSQKLSESASTQQESEATVDENTDKFRPHFPDTYKRETHPTFSTDSKYHDAEAGRIGGTWEKDTDGTWHFYAGPTNLQQHGVQGLQSHFEGTNDVLHLPEVPEAGAGKRFEDFFKTGAVR